ncbi:hypothetical protein BAnh1_01450 [Bartonella australis AUST/NH1]|uniref:YlxR domain-containing protein n=1 Tax=Bartonella australis (strain Aust/NH1) TaxID=1094489 RepID=M1NX48_BARAA|nr:RNA-binding protein [Bartonella australis]AGF74037.1 hypothetical protein BAnh1_01450 [Bartonella australis AUST/NH1]
MNERTCIITKKSAPTARLIRFVVGPNNQIIPDLKGNLPGRGVWVSAHRTTIEEAIKRRAFSKNLKEDVEAVPDLADIVDKLLLKATLGSLSMARKAGAVVTGSTKIDAAIRSGQVILVLHAKEAAENGKRKISQAICAIQQQKNQNVETISLLTSDEMSMAFGTNPVIHAALLNMKAADGFLTTMHKLIAYRGDKCDKSGEITAKVAKEIQ